MADNSKGLTKFKLGWLQECSRVKEITALELRICIELATHYVSMTGTADKFGKTDRVFVFPSQSALASTLNVSRQGIQKALRRLINRKVMLLAKQGGKGRKLNNEYELTALKKSPSSGSVSSGEAQRPKRYSNGSVLSGERSKNKRSSVGAENATIGVARIPYRDSQAGAKLRPGGATAPRRLSVNNSTSDRVPLKRALFTDPTIIKLCSRIEQHIDPELFRTLKKSACRVFGQEHGVTIAGLAVLISHKPERFIRQLGEFERGELSEEKAQELEDAAVVDVRGFVAYEIKEEMRDRRQGIPTVENARAYLRERLQTFKQKWERKQQRTDDQ